MSREWRRPVLCLITDRLRLAEGLGRPGEEATDLLLQQIEGAIRGGIDVVQIRERDLSARELSTVVRAAVAAAVGTPAAVVVNDRVDVALAEMSSGVHLREDSIGIRDARTLLREGQVIGRSVHSADGAAAANDADYLIAGSVFESSSKPDAEAQLGITGLRAVVERARSPVWAIGGLTLKRAALVAGTGAAGVAAISLFIPAGRSANLVNMVQELTSNLRFSFDSTWRRS